MHSCLVLLYSNANLTYSLLPIAGVANPYDWEKIVSHFADVAKCQCPCGCASSGLVLPNEVSVCEIFTLSAEQMEWKCSCE